MSLLSNYFKSLEGLDDILVYFNSTYVKGNLQIHNNGVRYNSLSTISTNIFTIHVEHLQCHKRKLWLDQHVRKLKNIVRIKHPNLYIFIESQMCNASATTVLV